MVQEPCGTLVVVVERRAVVGSGKVSYRSMKGRRGGTHRLLKLHRSRSRRRGAELLPDIILLGAGSSGHALGRILVEGDDLGDGLRVRGLLLLRNSGIL